MGQEKRPFSLRISNDLYRAIERQAEREGRTPSNLGEVLIGWAHKQLQIAGNSINLLEMDVEQSRSSSEIARHQATIGKQVYEQHTEPTVDSKAKRNRPKTA